MTPERVAQAIAALAGGGAELPPGYLYGLTLRNDTDASHDIEISTGEARDEGDAVDLVLTALLTKRIDAAWAVGDNNGGLNTGTVAADTWYEMHLIRRSDTGVVDAMFTTTANRATLPTSYDSQRRIGWVRTDGAANILAFTQVGDYFTLTASIEDAQAATPTTAESVTLTVPTSTIARFRASLAGDSGDHQVVIFSELVTNSFNPSETFGASPMSITTGTPGTSEAGNPIAAGHFEIPVNSSSQIRVAASAADGDYNIWTFGWIDHRGRLYP
jgi:hypothetical protein